MEALTDLEHAKPSQDKLLMLSVLTENVSSVDERLHEALLQRVLSTSLWRCSDEVVDLTVAFIVNLVVTHTGSLLQSCLDLLVASFVPPPGHPLEALKDPGLGRWGGGEGSPTPGRAHGDPRGASEGGGAVRTAAATTAMVVGAVEQVLTLVPLAAAVCRPILLSRIPHKSSGGALQCQYLRAAFRLVETAAGAPLRDALLQGVVSHLLEVDVEIKWEDIKGPDDEDEDDEDEDEDEDGVAMDGKDGGGAGIFELDDIEKTIEEQLMLQAAEWERARAGSGAGASPRAYSSDATVDETADALDSMMEATLAHVDTRIDRGDGAAVSDALLRVFVATLLPAHRSKFTQFLLFHACARDAAGAMSIGGDGKGVTGGGSGLGGGEAVGYGVAGGKGAMQPGAESSRTNGTGVGLGLASKVVDRMIAQLTDPHHAPAGRLAAAAYLASFLARAAFLPPAFLAATLSRLAAWCTATVQAATSGKGVTGVAGAPKMARSGSATGGLARGFGSSFTIADDDADPGTGDAGGDAGGAGGEGNVKLTDTEQREFESASAATLAVVASACQALMYVLCYRMEDILRAGGEPAAVLRRLPLRDILYSKLCPLQTCLPSVVGEFLHRAVSAGIEGFDRALLDRHKREMKEKEAAGAAGKAGALGAGHGAPGQGGLTRTTSAAVLGLELAEAVRHRRPLRMFFPFDPYLLRRSAALLRLPLTYVTWRGSAQNDDDENSDDDDLDDDVDVDEDLDADDDGEDEEILSSDEEEEMLAGSGGGRGDRGARSGSQSSSHRGSFGGLGLPNSLNPRPRKRQTRGGLLGPQPLFGGDGGSGGSPGGGPSSVSPSRGLSNGALPGFGDVGSGGAIIGFPANANGGGGFGVGMGGNVGGVPSTMTFGWGSAAAGTSPMHGRSPSPLGASPSLSERSLGVSPLGSGGASRKTVPTPPRIPKRAH